ELSDIDRLLDGGDVSDSNLLRRSELHCSLYNINQMESKECLQKSKIKWAIEGDENSNFFHGLINKKGSHVAIHGVFVDGICKRLSDVQASDLERRVSRDEIRLAVWNCEEKKSPGPDDYSFEFSGNIGTLFALIYITDAKFVNDFRPISLIGSVNKVVTKELANRLALLILDLISDTQSAFVANRQILDGPFILNELLHWCKRKKKQVMFFKVDFVKAYDSIRWDYLLDVLEAFGFGNIWCKWIRRTFSSAKDSVLVNGSPTIEFPFYCGLKQGDPLSSYLFILIMESFNMSFTRVIDEGVFKGVFKGVHLHGSTSIFYLFYTDDVMFIGEWSDDNLKGIINILQCFFLASGLKINIQKSQVLGVGVPSSIVMQAASSIGCGVLHKQFRYLGVMVGECMSRHNAWASTVDKLRSRLFKWKMKTLSIGGRLTLLKLVLGASPLYNMSIFKVPKGILNSMEAIRSKFFNGMEPSTNKITWAAWNKVLASKENGGIGVSSYHALNHALLLKWVLRFISQDGPLWFRVIKALYGNLIDSHPVNLSSNWCSIICELHLLEVTVANKVQGVVSSSFRRPVRAGSEYQHLTDLNSLMESVSLSHSCDRWICDLSGDGEFRVKEVRNFLDNLFLSSYVDATRWVKYILIKINVFVWRARRDFLPTRVNLSRRGLLGKVKEFSSFDNMRMVLGNEGFNDIDLRYMGGMWIMIGFKTEDTKAKFQSCLGVTSWFSQIIQASKEFVIDERITWVDIEGIPFKLWSESNDFDVNNSLDPFELYPLLNKKKTMEEKMDKSNGTVSIPFPHGFTPCDETEVECDKKSTGNNKGSGFGNEKGESVSIGSRKSNKIDIQRTGVRY
nr:RNA-directed DNA polymerase, eukaryota [Tanacetum cinerariifolium]